MAKLREPDRHRAGLEARALLAARDRECGEDYARSLGEFPARNYMVARADAIERGEPAQVTSWEIAGLFLGVRASPHRDFILQPDGSLVPR